MTGQIPPYGKNFKHDRAKGWHPVLGQAIYVLKRDNEWFIRADKGSKRWYVFHGYNRDMATCISRVLPNMRSAMELMIDGIDQGFYVLDNEGVHAPNCGLQGSGLDKKCTCHVDFNNSQ